MPQPDPLSAWQMFISLLPVITGGLIGIVGGLSGTAFGRLLQSKHDKATLRRAKLEAAVNYIFELEPWGMRARHYRLFNTGEQTYDPSPSAKIRSLAILYFPELQEEARALDLAADKYELALMSIATAKIAAQQAAMEAAFAETNNAEQAQIAGKAARIPTDADVKKAVDAYEPIILHRQGLLKKAQDLSTIL